MKKSSKMHERDVLRACLDYLEAKRIFHYRNNTGAVKTDKHFLRFGAVGSPDIIAVIHGQFIGIECKAPNGKQSDAQKTFQSALEKAGGQYYLVYRPEDLIKII